jgi:hypothetical protein
VLTYGMGDPPFFFGAMGIMALETIIFIFFSQSALFFFPSLFLHIHERQKLIVGSQHERWKIHHFFTTVRLYTLSEVWNISD